MEPADLHKNHHEEERLEDVPEVGDALHEGNVAHDREQVAKEDRQCDDIRENARSDLPRAFAAPAVLAAELVEQHQGDRGTTPVADAQRHRDVVRSRVPAAEHEEGLGPVASPEGAEGDPLRPHRRASNLLRVELLPTAVLQHSIGQPTSQGELVRHAGQLQGARLRHARCSVTGRFAARLLVLAVRVASECQHLLVHLDHGLGHTCRRARGRGRYDLIPVNPRPLLVWDNIVGAGRGGQWHVIHRRRRGRHRGGLRPLAVRGCRLLLQMPEDPRSAAVAYNAVGRVCRRLGAGAPQQVRVHFALALHLRLPRLALKALVLLDVRPRTARYVHAILHARALHSRGCVDRVAEKRELRLSRPDDAAENAARMHPDPHRDLCDLLDAQDAAGDLRQEPEGREHGVQRVGRVALLRVHGTGVLGHGRGHVRLANRLDLHGVVALADSVEIHPHEVQELH
mmetsp:Transcript_49588/g.138779  ORF Transcript_49588/g.138779 Transcript_49588/m.138779 type:complete len:456 (-) Transcript_49588:795-2162(-)